MARALRWLALALAQLGPGVVHVGGINLRSVEEAKTKSSLDYFVPRFFAPQLTPTQFLIVSSPTARKVVYTELKNFKSRTGRTFALVDSGLVEPAGLSFDQNRGALYVADRGASKIYRYRVLVEDSTAGNTKVHKLVTDGVQLCIMQGQSVEWVSVDTTGDVFYSDTSRNTINRIPVDTIDRLSTGGYQCGDLQVRSEKEQMQKAQEQALELQSMTDDEREASHPTDAPNTEPVIFSVYEGSISPHVAVPGGVASDGERLYWTNAEAGKQAGTVVEGRVQPDLPLAVGGSNSSAPAPFVSHRISTNADAAYGIAKSNIAVFYSTNVSGTGYVYGVMPGGTPQPFVSTLIEPRGLCWDGDNTVYVADERGNQVFSFPVGRLMEDAPLTESVALTGAFGVALFTLHDMAYDSGALARSAAAGPPAPWSSLAFAAVLALAVARAGP